MVEPDPALAPETLPVITPTVQAKLLGADAVKGILEFVPLQVFTEGALVTIGLG